MSKQTEAMKLALEALEVATTPLAKDRQEVLRAITALRQAIREAEEQAPWDAYDKAMAEQTVCDYCNHPLYAGTKCKNCGRVTEKAAIKRDLTPEQPAQPAKLKVTLEDRPIDIELAQYKRMFEAACSALGQIGDALGCDPEEGGAEPILAAIAELKAEQPAQPQQDIKFNEGLYQEREARLSQPQQEPVGRLESDPDEGHVFVPRIDGDWSMLNKDLYTSPPASKPWVGLTKADKKEIERVAVYVDGAIRLTEAKLREKNT